MKIQVISFKEIQEYNCEEIKSSNFKNCNSFDEYDVDIVDLRNFQIWENNAANYESINIIQDLYHIGEIISNVKKSRIVIFFPQNCLHSYHLISSRYMNHIELKNNIGNMSKIIFGSLVESEFYSSNIKFENTSTLINDKKISASFYFTNCKNELTKSYKSEKTTTFQIDSLVITSLDLKTKLSIFEFLNQIGLTEQKQVEPCWFNLIEKFDDKQLKEQNIINEKKVKSLKDTIQNNNEKIQENNFYKSILYTNGDELIEATYNILEELLNCSLSEFVDEYKEDFSIEKEKNVFVGEIKGVTSNVKNRHVSQIDNHVQDYNDKPEEEKNGKIPKGILIINYQREREPSKRDPIGENQISIAKRDGSLIITTFDLLDLYEDFRNGKITSEEIIEKFSIQTGLFERS